MTNKEAIDIMRNLQAIIVSHHKQDKETVFAIQMGIDALKAQEPKQVYITGQTSGIKVGMCPNCDNAISSEGSSHFCGKCGQAVKWE